MKVTLDELGIQHFADGEYDKALEVFDSARNIRLTVLGPSTFEYAMVLNNIACVEFLINNPKVALEMFQKARDIQLQVMKTSSTVGLHLLQAATTLCNMGYMKLRLRKYEDALSIFEEALLVSVWNPFDPSSFLKHTHKHAHQTFIPNNFIICSTFTI